MPGITPFRAFSISRLSGGANGCGPLSWHGRLARGRGTPRRWPILRPNNHPSEATDGFTHAKNAALLRLRPVYWSKAQERSVLRVREAIGRFARVVVWPEYRPTPRRTASTGEPPVPRKRAAPIRAAAQA